MWSASRPSAISRGLILFALPLCVALFCIAIGRYSLSMPQAWQALWRCVTQNGQGVEPQVVSVIMGLRLPRILLALCCGSSMALAGAALQTLFSNPMVSPDTLGVASGASLGAVLALMFDGGMMAVQISAFAFGLLALGLAVMVSRSSRHSSLVLFVLSGIMISALFQALVSLAKYVADVEEQLPAITYWLMGSLAGARFSSLSMAFPALFLSSSLLMVLRWRLNMLSLSDDEISSLGLNLKVLRFSVIVAATVLVGVTVALCGQVGWVGLLVPHAARMVFGNDHVKSLPGCASLGATFMVLIDTLARSVLSSEIPISILSSLIGAPFFILLLRRTGGAWR